jgi:hypothetical protein
MCTITNMYAGPYSVGPWTFVDRATLLLSVGRCGSSVNVSNVTDTTPALAPGLVYRLDLGYSVLWSGPVDCSKSTYKFFKTILFTPNPAQ